MTGSFANDCKAALTLLALILCASIGTGCAAPMSQLESQLATLPQAEAEAVAKVAESVVTLERRYNDGSRSVIERGTGFVLSEAVIVTSAHYVGYDIVSQALSVTATFADGTRMMLRTSWTDEAHDIAGLVPEDLSERFPAPAVAISRTDASVNEKVSLLGRKSGFRTGTIIANDDNRVLPSWRLMTTLDTSTGDSGAPVFNARGEVVAIHSASVNDDASMEVPIRFVFGSHTPFKY